MTEKKKYVNLGKRLKEEAKRHNEKNVTMAYILSYKNANTISEFYSGNRKLSDDRYEILCKRWGVRKEYLMCEDEWRTAEDMLIGISIKDIESFRLSIKYIESLGYRVRDIMTMTLPVRTIYSDLSIISECLPETELNRIMQEYDFTLDYKTFVKNYSLKSEKLVIKKSLDKLPIDDMSSIGKNTSLGDLFGHVLVPADKSILGINTEYSLMFQIEKSDNESFSITASDLQSILKRIDRFTKFFLDDLFQEN